MQGTAERENAKLISCVKALSFDGGNNFVAGESHKNSSQYVAFYDASSQPFDKTLHPVVTFAEHEVKQFKTCSH